MGGVASRKMRKKSDAGGEVQHMTKGNGDGERDGREENKRVGTGVESGVRRHAREGSGYS